MSETASPAHHHRNTEHPITTMRPDDFTANEQQFRELLRFTGSRSLLAVLLSFALYGVAIWLWTTVGNIEAILAATVGYLLFRTHKRWILRWFRHRHADNPHYADMLRLTQQALETAGVNRLLIELDTLAREADASAPR